MSNSISSSFMFLSIRGPFRRWTSVSSSAMQYLGSLTFSHNCVTICWNSGGTEPRSSLPSLSILKLTSFTKVPGTTPVMLKLSRLFTLAFVLDWLKNILGILLKKLVDFLKKVSFFFSISMFLKADTRKMGIWWLSLRVSRKLRRKALPHFTIYSTSLANHNTIFDKPIWLMTKSVNQYRFHYTNSTIQNNISWMQEKPCSSLRTADTATRLKPKCQNNLSDS